MKLRKLKTEAEARAAMVAPTPGRDRVEFTTKDGSFTNLRLGQLHVFFGQYGSTLELSAEQEFDTVERHKVVATVEGFPPATTYHEDYTDAAAKKASYGSGVTVELTTDRVSVLVDESGNVVREADAPVPAAADDGTDIPF